MSGLAGWTPGDIERFRKYLRTRVQLIGLDPRLRVRVDESDIVAETLLRVARSKEGLQHNPDPQVLAYLRRVRDAVVIDFCRAHHAQERDIDREQHLRAQLDQSSVGWEANVTAGDATPSAIASRQEVFARVAVAIQELPEDQRQAVLGVLFLNQSLQEVADQHGKTRGQVAGAYSRGMVRLREMLRDLDQPSG